jgi:diacylglycerol O-acyltransferase
MGQLDRLSALDATFLHQERESSHMHIGGVGVFDGPCPSLDEFIEHLDARLSGLPRYRQKLMFGRLGPRWVDDDAFDLRYHVRSAALPSPAGDAELSTFVALVAGQRLDRSRPLWEAWLVEAGPAHFALVFKSHHAMVDGVSNFDLATVLLDLEPNGVGGRPAATEPAGAAGVDVAGSPGRSGLSIAGAWSPLPAPSRGDLLFAEARDAVDTGLGLAGRALGAALRPDRAVREAVEVGKGVGELAWAAMNPAPETPLNVEIGPHRRYAVVHQSLSDYKAVKNAFGGTVNDVVLAVVAGSLRRWLLAHDVDVEGLELRALVPVSVRGEESHGSLGNQLSMLRAPLPVYMADPVAALGVVREAMRGIKESRQAVAASQLTSAASIAPPGVLAQASRLQFSTRLFNLLVTNIPGPQIPLYLLGRRVSSLYPLPFLAEHHGLAVAIISYDGQIEYGLLGDYNALGDLDLIADGIEASLEELVAAAAASSAVRRSRASRGPGSAVGAETVARAKVPVSAAKPATKRRAPPAKQSAGPKQGAPQASPEVENPELAPSDVPLMGSTTRRRSGPGSDMRAKRHSS